MPSDLARGHGAVRVLVAFWSLGVSVGCDGGIGQGAGGK